MPCTELLSSLQGDSSVVGIPATLADEEAAGLAAGLVPRDGFSKVALSGARHLWHCCGGQSGEQQSPTD